MRKSIEVMESKVRAFNRRNPVGKTVTVIKDLGEEIETRVKYPAEVLSGHTPVVWLDGISGAYLLDRVISYPASAADERLTGNVRRPK